MKKISYIILPILITLTLSGCTIDIKTNKELKEEIDNNATINGLQQRVESLNKEVGLAQQELSGLQLQKQISDLQAENEKLKKTTTTKTTTNNTIRLNTTNNTRAMQEAIREELERQAKIAEQKAIQEAKIQKIKDIFNH